MGLVEYLPDDDSILAEIQRIVKPGGKIVVTLRNGRCLERRLWKLYNKVHINKYKTTYDYREHDPEAFRTLTAAMGFVNYSDRICHFYPLPWPLSTLLPSLNSYLANHMERLFSRTRFYFLGSTLISSFVAPDGETV